MTRLEQVWKPINDHWQPYRQVEPDSDKPASARLLQDIRDLQQIRMPVKAVELIGHALRQAYQSALESSECANCGVRCDETDICSRCGKRVDIICMDTTAGVCDDCTEEEEEIASETDDL